MNIEDDHNNYLLDHYESPYHKGILETATHTCHEQSKISGDWIELQLQISDDRIEQAYFQGQGSIVTLAAASILCQYIQGKSTAEIHNLQAQMLLDLLRVPLTPNRQRCALLGFKALKTIVYSLDENAKLTL